MSVQSPWLSFLCCCFSPCEKKKRAAQRASLFLVGEGGFEPPKSVTTDLQSAPFGRSGIPPYSIGAGGRIRTPDLLITNQLLYQLSYTSSSNSMDYFIRAFLFCQHFLFYFFVVFTKEDIFCAHIIFVFCGQHSPVPCADRRSCRGKSIGFATAA